jgi:hypothetical protein
VNASHSVGALAQFRRELRAGLRTANDPADALWSAAWRELAGQCWRIAGNRPRAAAILREAARIIVEAAERKRVGRSV